MSGVTGSPAGSERGFRRRALWPGAVDQVGVEARAAALATRSVKRESKRFALELAIRCCDLTTLEGADTPGAVASLCAKARIPDPDDRSLPAIAAVCVYPTLVPAAVAALGESGVRVASVATAFPSGHSPLSLKLEEVRTAVAFGADEIDMVIDRGAFLAGETARVHDEIEAVKAACGDARLKVILETGELGSLDAVRRASLLAIDAGADFIKTSTGKLPTAATLPVALVMLEAVRDAYELTARRVGVKVAGGVRTAKNAIQYLVVVRETLGAEWLTPELFRIGASSLLNDILMQLRKERTGVYQSRDYFGDE